MLFCDNVSIYGVQNCINIRNLHRGYDLGENRLSLIVSVFLSMAQLLDGIIERFLSTFGIK